MPIELIFIPEKQVSAACQLMHQSVKADLIYEKIMIFNVINFEWMDE